MFPNFKIIKFFYERKLWSKEQVAKAVECGNVTKEEYEEIVGEAIE